MANKFYGVPLRKLKLQSLGTDTELFRPPSTPEDMAARGKLRADLGFAEDAIVCVYTGRFTADKNPLTLAHAVERLAAGDARFCSLFVKSA